MYHDFIDGRVQISPSAYITNSSKNMPTKLDWWRCDKCGAAIGKENHATHAEQMTCYMCGSPRPARYNEE